MIRLRTLGGILIAAMCAAPAGAQEESEFQPLPAWEPAGPDSVADVGTGGLLRITAGSAATRVNYGEFVLRFSYRVIAAGGSGALVVRAQLDDPPQRYPRGDTVALAGDPGLWIACEVRAAGAELTRDCAGALDKVSMGGPDAGRLVFSAIDPGIEVRNVRIAALPEPGRERRAGEAFGAGAVYRETAGVTLPELVHQTPPKYTAELMRDQVKGLVLLNLVAGADGRPGDIRVVRSPHPDLTRQAIACVREWLFKPATRDGAPVPIVATVEVVFHIAPKK